MLVTPNLKLLLVRLSTLFVFNELFEYKAVHTLFLMPFSIVDLNSIDLSRTWVYHLVSIALERALCEDYLAFELLAVVAKAQMLRLVSVLHLH